MSKAFVNEDAPVPETDLQRRELVDPAQNYMTPQGLANLQKEISQLNPSDSRYAPLDKLIKTAKVIVPEKQFSDRIIFGATIQVRGASDEIKTYKLVGANESDISAGKISFLSPLGKALLQARVGDLVTLRSPRGEEELEIMSIEFKPI
jgi:transcription elongation factor GreB